MLFLRMGLCACHRKTAPLRADAVGTALPHAMFDRFTRRYYPAIVAALLLLCAYLQGRAASSLIAFTLVPASLDPLPPPRAMPVVAESRPSAQAILDRNPFDSTTGALGPRAKEEFVVPAITDPRWVPKCEGIRVESTAVATDPRWSSAIVQPEDGDHGRLCRVGDVVGGLEVAYIGYNPAQASPTVWLAGAERLCQANVFDPIRKGVKAKRGRHRRRARARVRSSSEEHRKPTQLPRRIARHIRRVSSTEFVIERRAVDMIFDRQATLMRSVRLRPNQQGGEVTSLTLSRLGRGPLLSALGLRNGDQIQSINGYSLTSPEKALEAYARMRTASKLELSLQRRGRPLTIEYRIE